MPSILYILNEAAGGGPDVVVVGMVEVEGVQSFMADAISETTVSLINWAISQKRMVVSSADVGTNDAGPQLGPGSKPST